jgi:hypothetical protein
MDAYERMEELKDLLDLARQEGDAVDELRWLAPGVSVRYLDGEDVNPFGEFRLQPRPQFGWSEPFAQADVCCLVPAREAHAEGHGKAEPGAGIVPLAHSNREVRAPERSVEQPHQVMMRYESDVSLLAEPYTNALLDLWQKTGSAISLRAAPMAAPAVFSSAAKGPGGPALTLASVRPPCVLRWHVGQGRTVRWCAWRLCAAPALVRLRAGLLGGGPYAVRSARLIFFIRPPSPEPLFITIYQQTPLRSSAGVLSGLARPGHLFHPDPLRKCLQ